MDRVCPFCSGKSFMDTAAHYGQVRLFCIECHNPYPAEALEEPQFGAQLPEDGGRLKQEEDDSERDNEGALEPAMKGHNGSDEENLELADSVSSTLPRGGE